MKSGVHNYRRKRTFATWVPLLPTALIPLALVGYTVRPALDYSRLAGRLASAEQRALDADELAVFLTRFGEDGPPTQRLQQVELLLAERLPGAFEPTEFFEAALAASRGLDIELHTIVPLNEKDLGLPVAQQSIFERRATLKGRGRVDHINALLAGLHREGNPVCVHECSLQSLEDNPGKFDFKLELGVFFRATPVFEDELDESL